jgi:hypothetical protein
MKEERRNMGQVSSEHRDKKKKPIKHSRTKDQIVRLSEQMIERANDLASMVKGTTFDERVPPVETCSNRGRRWMDTENLDT